MKIQCDVCNKDEATMFCVADDAALCEACDHRVHHANKLAGKHQRFSLLKPSAKEIPLCDICQERKAFLFCQQDRAILCRECDVSIHKVNEHTQKHIRFLLTGVKLSATSTLYSSSSSSSSASVPICKPQGSIKKGVSLSASISSSDDLMNGSTSSISDYLMEMLPGWHVEDFLDSFSLNGFSKNTGDYVEPFWEGDLGMNTSLWVPQAPPLPVLPTTQIQTQTYTAASTGVLAASASFGGQICFNESKDDRVTMMKKPSGRKWSHNHDNSFAVPQIKRSRTFCYSDQR